MRLLDPHLALSYTKDPIMGLGAKHRDIVYASHPSALGSILGVSKTSFDFELFNSALHLKWSVKAL